MRRGMAVARDLSDMSKGSHPFYIPIPGVEQLAVGWLSRDNFRTQEPPPGFIERLTTWVKFEQYGGTYAGHHSCDILPCAKTFGRTRIAGAPLGSKEIYVPHPRDRNIMFCAPDLILHYVLEHRFLPPDAFVESVL